MFCRNNKHIVSLYADATTFPFISAEINRVKNPGKKISCFPYAAKVSKPTTIISLPICQIIQLFSVLKHLKKRPKIG